MKFWIEKTIKYISSPIILSGLLFSMIFYYHLGEIFNFNGIILFLAIILLFNVFWIYILVHFLSIKFSNKKLLICYFWILSVGIVQWLILSKIDVELNYLRDIIITIITFLPVFVFNNKHISPVLFAYSVLITYSFYFSFQKPVFFYILLFLLFLTGLYATFWTKEHETDLKQGITSIIQGIFFTIILLLISNAILKTL